AQLVAAGDTVVRPANPTKDKHKFAGWYANAGFTVRWNFPVDTLTSDTTLYARWISETITTYIVAFETNGGSCVDPQLVAAGEAALRPANSLRAHHTFVEWCDNDGVKYNFNRKVYEDMAIYAKWKKDVYTVNFEVDGVTISTQQVPYGDTTPRPANPTKSSYLFAGWYANANFAALWNFPTDTVTGNMTLYARWIDDTIITYTVAFESNGGSRVASQLVVAGDTVVRPTNPTKDKHKFAGWYANAAFTARWNFPVGTLTSDTMLYARWISDTITTYTVAFSSNGGSRVDAQLVAAGDTVARPANPTKGKHKFGGWYANAGFTACWNFPVGTLTSDTTLYARWISDAITTYTVAFGSNGGSRVDPQLVAEGEAALRPTNPNRTHHTFIEWCDNDGVKYNFNRKVYEDMALHAKWEKTVYTVNFEVDGVVLFTQQASHGNTMTRPVNPTKSRHQLSSWYVNAGLTGIWNFPTDTVTGNMTLYACWREQKLDSIKIGGVLQEVKDTIYYTVPCGDSKKMIDVVYTAASNTDTLHIDATNPFRRDIAIKLEFENEVKKQYTLRMEKMFDFNSIAHNQFGGRLFMVIKNPKNNSNFNFIEARWYRAKDKQLLSNKFYYASPSGEPITDSIYVALRDSTGAWLVSCPYSSTAVPGKRAKVQQMIVYPNPVSVGAVVRLKEEFLVDHAADLEERYTTLYLVDVQGRKVYAGEPSELRRGLAMPTTIGVYFIVLEGKAGRDLIKVSVVR
ncbi:MAG: InlB B-repeat-containing protein, partial [Prevotellaceae bacterium]|nr:InlB B-repeat-containing protein [Prevotellaceae bacterium]